MRQSKKIHIFSLWTLNGTQCVDDTVMIAGIDNKKQISDRQKLQEIENQQREEEDEECRIFAAAKRKMAKLRMEKEKQLHE